jgi:CubicO group peptidase (beta-lactamase class C family)
MTRWFKRVFFGLFGLIALASLLLLLSGNEHLFKGVANTYLLGRSGPSIDEYAIFENREVPAGEKQEWPTSKAYNTVPIPEAYLTQMEKYGTVAFLLFRKDSILIEKYWEGYDQQSLTNSFSMAKTIVGILTCMAMDDGLIPSVDQKVGDFLPAFNEGRKKELTIRHLLTMSSGMNFDESYGDPFGFMAKAYYGSHLEEKTMAYDVVSTPGERFTYLGGNTILLSLILKKATGKSISEYCSEKLWKPIGASETALWNLDGAGGIEKAYCCFYSNARDFGRIGQLFLHKGNWKGKQLLSEAIVETATSPVELSKEKVDYYGWHWWVGQYNNQRFFYARGIQGQYIIVMPETETVIVRLGRNRSAKLANHHIEDVFVYQDLVKELIQVLEP